MDSGRQESVGAVDRPAAATSGAKKTNGRRDAVGSTAVDRLARFQSLTAALLECLTPADAAETVLKQGIAATGARAGSVVLLNVETGLLEVIGHAGYPNKLVDPWRAFPLDASVPVADAVRAGTPVFLESRAALAVRYPLLVTGADKTPDQAWAAVPFLLEGRAFGCLGLSYAEPQSFDEDEHAFLAALAQQCALAMERARLYATVKLQSTFLKDVLSSVTGGRLVLCETEADLPQRLPPWPAGTVSLAENRNVRTLRRAVSEAAAACGLTGNRVDDLLTAVGEAAANAVVHGGGGESRVYADTAAGQIQVWIFDRGKGIELHRLPKATLEKGYTTAGTLGHGFKMILSVIDRIYLITGPQGTGVVIEMGRNVPDPSWLRSVS